MGPLAGIRLIELAGIGPAPMAAMLLADLGADIVRVERPGGEANGLPVPRDVDFLARNRTIVEIDLKSPDGRDAVLALAAEADGLIEGFRPGVAERLGLGPADCHARNARLVYARMTGYGQSGPLADRAGHDINYIALTGALASIGRPGEPPVPPLNLVGDFGGGALYLAFGMVAGLLRARIHGTGDTIDAAMVDGAASLMTMHHALSAGGLWPAPRGNNILDGGAPFYDTYVTADGRAVAVGAIEPKFFRILADLIGLDAEDCARQLDRAHWPRLRAKMAAAFLARPRDEWAAAAAGLDACLSPVLEPAEAPAHPHLAARATFENREGRVQPAAAPRFAKAGAAAPGGVRPVSGLADVLRRWSAPFD